jgi:hypothetical protein
MTTELLDGRRAGVRPLPADEPRSLEAARLRALLAELALRGRANRSYGAYRTHESAKEQP